jgi:hypothetical protein
MYAGSKHKSYRIIVHVFVMLDKAETSTKHKRLELGGEVPKLPL